MIKEYLYDREDGFKGYNNSKPTAICLGFFDGLHLGHLSIVDKALKENANVSLLTFDGSLKFLTSKRDKPEVLTSIPDREDILNTLGVKSLFVVNFDKSIENMEANEFISKVLKPLNIKSIYVGEDFRFGKKALGDISLLKKYFEVSVVDFIYAYDKVKISSTLIISLIKNGEIEKANKFLGRNYSVKGEVVHGLENGRKMGFPTLNIKPSFNYVVPKNGVYASIVEIDGKSYLSMTDVGFHPTIDKLSKISIETNVFNYQKDSYGKKIKLSFLSFIRDEIHFDSISELAGQLDKDQREIKSRFNID